MQNEQNLRERIKTLDLTTICNMSCDGLKLLTGYKEPLVRALICQGKDNSEQREIFMSVKKGYKEWMTNNDMYWRIFPHMQGTPEYMDKLQLDIECGELITNREPVYTDDVKEDERNLTKVDLEVEIEKLKARIKDLEAQLEEVRNKDKGISLGLNQDQAALFGLSLANAFGFNYTNKKKDLSPMLHGIFGWGESRLKQGLSNPYKKAEKEKLANLFKDLCPHLYDVIMNKGERLP